MRTMGSRDQNKRPQTYPTPHTRDYARCMSPRPASFFSRSSPDPRRVIGLFLVKLFAYLVRLQASGQTVVLNDIAHMVNSADAMVNGFIRTLAVKQLKLTGYADAAGALRATDSLTRTRRAAQAKGGADSFVSSYSYGHSLRTERVQSCEFSTTEDLIARLQTTIETFERADAIASLIARIMVCVLACRSPGSRERLVHSRDATLPPNPSGGACPCPPTIIPVGRGPPCPWPPPILDPGSPPGKAAESKDHHINSFPGARSRVRDPEKT